VNQISDLAKLDFKTSVFILGSAPSLKLIKKYRHLTGIKIAVGDVPWRAPKLGPFDYWVTANAAYPLPWKRQHFRHLLKSHANILLSSTSVNLEKNIESVFVELDRLRKILPITFYDQRHIDGVLCNPVSPCCSFSKNFVRDRAIQEMLNSFGGNTGPAYSEGDSVTLHALALAVLLQSANIYVIGVEIPLVYKNYKYYKDYRVPFETPINLIKRITKRYIPKYRHQVPATSHNQIRFFQDFQKIVNIANKSKINVYSLSRTSPINYMDGVKYLDK